MKPATALLLALVPVIAPAAQESGAVSLDQRIRALTVTARVLIIGAHPDDEDTRLITWLSRGRGIETAYLSLTRGENGTNVAGYEIGDGLGAVRTAEVLEARRIDGAQQFFTRAFDFGYSRTAEETFTHWPQEGVLSDMVTILQIRSVQQGLRRNPCRSADERSIRLVSGNRRRRAAKRSLCA
jgi:hypothetical protein